LKYQLSTGGIVIVSSIKRAASVEIPAKSTSVPAMKRLAVNPAPAPAKPAAKPARGCLPNLKKTTAPSAGMITAAASEAKLPIIPTNTTVYVTKAGGDFKIVLRIAYSKSLILYEIPIPSIIDSPSQSV